MRQQVVNFEFQAKKHSITVTFIDKVGEFQKRHPQGDAVQILNREIKNKTVGAVKQVIRKNKVKPTDKKALQKIADGFKLTTVAGNNRPRALREYDKLLKRGMLTTEQHERLVEDYNRTQEEAVETSPAAD